MNIFRTLTKLRSLGPLGIACAKLFASGCSRDSHGPLNAGEVAPDLLGKDGSGETQALSSQRGHHAIVYFYPKDSTPGCTKEACAFRDNYDDFQKRNVIVFGVSRDSAESHEKFRRKYRLPFVLVADEDGLIEKAYGASGMFGVSARVTFLVAPDGTIQKVWPHVDPGLHATQILAALDAQ